MHRLLKIIFVLLVVKPIVLFLLGLNIIHRQKLPKTGPAIIAANHNSHLDTLVLLSLYPLKQIHKIRPVAAADYFLKNPLIAWFAINVIGIIPLQRQGQFKKSLFSACHEALNDGDILLIYPEGTRGQPEQTGRLKKGIYYLINERSDTKVTPLATHGLGRALPKGEALLVPFNCDVVIGDPLTAGNCANQFIKQLGEALEQLKVNGVTFREDEKETIKDKPIEPK